MAQRTSRRSRMRALARRYGLTARRGTIVALSAFMALLVIVGVLYVSSRNGFALIRSADNQRSADRATASGIGEDAQLTDVGLGVGNESTEAKGNTSSHAEGASTLYVIHVDGAVQNPGVYELVGSNLRYVDAVEKAGGLLPDADTSAINLAAPLVDGAKLHVPMTGEAGVAAGIASAAASGESAVGLVNLNTASSEELQTLSGIGEATAQAIIDEREAHGPFVSIEDVMRVSGIGEKKFARIKDHVCI